MNRGKAEEAPRFYERLHVGAGPRLLMWACTSAVVAAGLVLAVTSPRRSTLETLAGLVLTVGGIALVAAWRAGHYETVVTRTTLRAGFGPFARVYPAWGVRSSASRPVSGWRRHYARHEVVIELEAGAGTATVVVPTAEPDELAQALKRE